MGRGKPLKRKRHNVTREVSIDTTPERLAKGDHSEFVNPANIDSAEQPIGLTRRFSATHLDRLHRNGKITWPQWYAGDWYRATHARCRFGSAATSAYGERTRAADCPHDFGYGLPRQEAAVRARSDLSKARQQFSMDMRGFMERLLISDAMPKYGGRAAMRNLTDIRKALDTLAEYLRIIQP